MFYFQPRLNWVASETKPELLHKVLHNWQESGKSVWGVTWRSVTWSIIDLSAHHDHITCWHLVNTSPVFKNLQLCLTVHTSDHKQGSSVREKFAAVSHVQMRCILPQNTAAGWSHNVSVICATVSPQLRWIQGRIVQIIGGDVSTESDYVLRSRYLHLSLSVSETVTDYQKLVITLLFMGKISD